MLTVCVKFSIAKVTLGHELSIGVFLVRLFLRQGSVVA